MVLPPAFYFEPGIPENTLHVLKHKFNLKNANIILGGRYHNLKIFWSFRKESAISQYDRWPQLNYKIQSDSLFNKIHSANILFHTPYHHYNTVVRFFNEAAIDISVKKIYVTLYRIAKDSRIANALISAARNGKRVVVFVELKARFDEANNLKWAKRIRKLQAFRLLKAFQA